MFSDRLIFTGGKIVFYVFTILSLILSPIGYPSASTGAASRMCCQPECLCCQVQTEIEAATDNNNCDCEMKGIPDSPDFPQGVIYNLSQNFPDNTSNFQPVFTDNEKSQRRFIEDYDDVLLASNSPPLYILNSSFII